MEIWKVVGVDKKATMRIKEDNKTYTGVRWFLVGEPVTDDPNRYLGDICKDQFVSAERMNMLKVDPVPGDVITLYFDRSGSICKVDVAH